MTSKEYQRERRYQMAMHIARQMLKNGVITEDDYKVIDTNMTARFAPIFGTLFSDNQLAIKAVVREYVSWKGSDIWRKIRLVRAKIPVLKPQKRVAAYARVSKDTERLMHSASAQVSYYSDLNTEKT